MYKIMAVDDDSNLLNALDRVFRYETGWRLETFDDPEAALGRAHADRFDLFISDYKMPGMNGIDLLARLKSLQPDSMRIILSGQADIDSVIKAVNEAGIYRFICKPVQKYELMVTIHQALQYYETVRENRRLVEQVRRQQEELNNRREVLDRFAREHPALAAVGWDDDGTIILEP